MADYTTARIFADTNARLKKLLKSSKLSRDQFIDYILNEALDQAEDLAPGGTLLHVHVLRRDLKKPPLGNGHGERLDRLEKYLQLDAPAPSLRVAEDAPPQKAGGRGRS